MNFVKINLSINKKQYNMIEILKLKKQVYKNSSLAKNNQYVGTTLFICTTCNVYELYSYEK